MVRKISKLLLYGTNTEKCLLSNYPFLARVIKCLVVSYS